VSSVSYETAIVSFDAELARLRPDGAMAIDAHTHLGADIDGSTLALDELLALLDAASVEQACVFPLNDPERVPAYSLPNDRVLEWCQVSDGRLHPFCRLDPGDHPIAEAERCLDRGARGIKLHPRSQAFGFELEALDPIFTLAAEARVPILVHAGRGLPPIAAELARVIERHQEVTAILAHAAIADQGQITALLEGYDRVCYDCSTMFALDVLELLRRVPAERVVLGSDPPYGRPSSGLYMLLRCAAAAGVSEATLRAMLGETTEAALEGRPLPAAHAPPQRDERFELPLPLLRVHTFLTMAMMATYRGTAEFALGGIDLALAVCREPHVGAAAPALELIGEALAGARELLGEEFEANRRRAGELLHRAMTHAVTEVL
jgi:predicted TIM-barrel fold metal-dependent hydrolase